MALPSSGQLGYDDIRIELGIPAQSNFSLKTAREGGYVPLNPYSPSLPPTTGEAAISHWYSYCHTCTTLYSFNYLYWADKMSSPHEWQNKGEACSEFGNYGSDPAISRRTIYSSSATITVGSTLYELSGGIYVPFNFSGSSTDWQYITGVGPVRITGNTVSEVETCLQDIYLQLTSNHPGSGGSGYIDWNVYAYDNPGFVGSPVPVDTNIDLYLRTWDDIAGYSSVSLMGTLNSGNSSTGGTAGAAGGPLITSGSVEWYSINPTASGTQNYYMS